jgi:DNA/RNA endonuclease YhcR with UshA esterase domain
MRRALVSLVILFVATAGSKASNTLTSDQAKNHIGENVTVCGVVASTHYAGGSRGTPTFVNLDKPYPNQVFTILIWGEDLAKFSPRPSTWDGKHVCATGVISSYRGSAEIVAKSPGQVSVQ